LFWIEVEGVEREKEGGREEWKRVGVEGLCWFYLLISGY
jgi:hypothetical protein